MRRIWTGYAFGVAALALVLASGSASAGECDFLTGGGFIIRDSGAKANFGVGGGCKDGSPTFGHLEYIDHGTGLNVHWTSITDYFEVDSNTDPRGKPIGARRICGTARTNQYGDVDWFVIARDTGEPGVDDEFTIRLTTPGGILPDSILYTTEGDSDHTLGGSGPGGGNIQLHNLNPPTVTGTCPAFASGG
jgi:hypothetical protein